MTPQYRQWLQGIVNGTVSGATAQNRIEASALLQAVGDDGNIDARFIQDPYAFTGSDRGQVFSTTEGRGNNVGYGPQGLNRVNEAFKRLYLNEYPDGFDERGQTSSTGTNTPSGFGGGDSVSAAERARLAEEERMRNQLRSEITARGADVDSIYNQLFSDLDTLLRDRDAQLEEQYGTQLATATEQYTSAIPEIETSYAAIGASDSTDTSDAKTRAKKGFDETSRTIGENKKTDKTKLGQYGSEQRAKFTTDREAAQRNVGRAGETTDVDALRAMRNDLETNIGSAQNTRATLQTDAGARGEISRLTGDAGRFEAATNALDNIIKSSMSGAVKQAAVEAITNSAGLSDDEKKKVQQQYGNVYAEQAAL